MDWNCAYTEERLSDLLDASLLPGEAAAYRAHAAECAHCAKLVAQVGGLVTRMQQSALVEESPQLVGKILDATLGPRKPKRASRGWFGWVPVLWQPRFAIGILTAAASLVIVVNAIGSSPVRTSLNPVNLTRSANRQAHLTYARGVKFVNDLRVVYEIQSRLSSQPESISEPTSIPASPPSGEPQPLQEKQKNSNGPREKSQTIPQPIRRNPRGSAEMAIMIATGSDKNSLYGVLRRPL
jgi:hypothetical protein